MEIVNNDCMLESNFRNESSTLYHLSSMPDDRVFNTDNQLYDSSICQSFENFNILDESPSKFIDDASDNASSSLDTEFEVLLHDYSVIKRCLQTDSCQRSDSEVNKLSQLLESIKEFRYFNSSELEMMCQRAKLLTIDEINRKIVKKFSTKDKWFFILNGSLRLEGETTTILIPGDFYGSILDTPDLLIYIERNIKKSKIQNIEELFDELNLKLTSIILLQQSIRCQNKTEENNVYSNSDYCDLMVISKDDLIPSQELVTKTNDEDRTIIAVYEPCINNSDLSKNFSYVLTKGTLDVLIKKLTTKRNVHREFVEDFFVTYKIFNPDPFSIMESILSNLTSDLNESKAKFEILLQWLSQNYKEFEKEEAKMSFLNQIIEILSMQKNQDYLLFLYDTCTNHASARSVRCRLSFKDNIVSVPRDSDQFVFYIHNLQKEHKLLMDGDIILAIEDYSHHAITIDLVKKLCDELKELSLIVRNDPLGYHENVVNDLSFDTCSIYSTPSTVYSQSHSDKISDSVSISTNDSDVGSPAPTDKSPNNKKRPSLIPNFLTSIQNGTVGRFFKNPKYYSKTLVPNNRSISDVSSLDFSTNFQRQSMSVSTISIQRFSRRIKHQRKSAGSNPEIIKSFDDKDLDSDLYSFYRTNQKQEFPIRIYFKDIFIYRSESLHNSSNKSELKFIHIMIKPIMPVSEVIIIALLKLNLASVSSSEFFLVEVKVDESNMMIHEKILKPASTNLKLKVQSKFYLKHSSFIGSSLILQKEAEKMIEEFQSFTILKLPVVEFAIELFIRSHKCICNFNATDLITYVTASKATLKTHRLSNQTENEFDKYIQLSDFYKNWVISEICSEQMCPMKRAKLISFFIRLASKAQIIGHIDLFFSLISGLDSMEISRLSQTWDRVSNSDKKLFKNLKNILNVTGNLRHLRILQQKITSPFIPVTALVVKDLTMIEEANPTYVEGKINGLQVNKNLINFDKMRKMARLSRNFINSICTCDKDKSKPIRKHFYNCTTKLENEEILKGMLHKKLKGSSRNSQIVALNYDRKHSVSNASVKSSSSESISHPASPVRVNSDLAASQAFNFQNGYLWIDFYLSNLNKMVINDPMKLSEISLSCEPNIQHNQSTLKSKQVKSQKSQDDLIFNHNHFQTNSEEINDISDKAAEILGLKAKSTIHKYKKGTES